MLRARQIKAPFIDISEPEIVLPDVEGEEDKVVLKVENYKIA